MASDARGGADGGSGMTAPEARAICPLCGKTFGAANALAQHVRDKHPNGAEATALRCPKCNGAPAFSIGRFGVRAACCGLWSWNMKPLTDHGTHAMRIEAHRAFDAIWKRGLLGRGECYRRLALLMGMPQAECHISMFDAAQARIVVALAHGGDLLDDAMFNDDRWEQAA